MGIGIRVGVGMFVTGRVGVAGGVGGMGEAAVGERNSAFTFGTMGKPIPADPKMRLVTRARKIARKPILIILARVATDSGGLVVTRLFIRFSNDSSIDT